MFDGKLHSEMTFFYLIKHVKLLRLIFKQTQTGMIWKVFSLQEIYVYE